MYMRLCKSLKTGGMSISFLLEMTSESVPNGSMKINDMTTFETTIVMFQTVVCENTVLCLVDESVP